MTYTNPDDDTPWIRANKTRCIGLIITGYVLGLATVFTIITTTGGAA